LAAPRLLQQVGEQRQRLAANELVTVAQARGQARYVRVHQCRVLRGKQGNHK
jgi:hypothetical protein